MKVKSIPTEHGNVKFKTENKQDNSATAIIIEEIKFVLMFPAKFFKNIK